jgi:hypothetical protein
VRRVNKVSATIDESVKEGERCRMIELPPQAIATETQP